MVSKSSGEIDFPQSIEAHNAFKDLETLGYDVDALMRRNMNDSQIVELRDKAFHYRGMEMPKMDDLVNLFSLGVDLSIRSSRDEGRTLARHILYLAERELSQS
ncbi:MAG: hypothetical protein ACREAZ_02420 [Nitrososphaera sp.]